MLHFLPIGLKISKCNCNDIFLVRLLYQETAYFRYINLINIFSALLRKKQSGAAGRKRKREAEKEALVSSQLMARFLKKSKLNATERVDSAENTSEDDGCQPIILKDGKEVGELYHNDNLLEKTNVRQVLSSVPRKMPMEFLSWFNKTSSLLG